MSIPLVGQGRTAEHNRVGSTQICGEQMTTTHHTGSCLCGKVRFEVKGNFESFFLCHCERCRKDTGSAHAANLFSTSAKIEWISGYENVQVFNLPTTQHVKSFCLICGSALPSIQMEGRLLVVPAGSLESDVKIRPNAHIFFSSKANWDTGFEDVPRFPELPS